MPGKKVIFENTIEETTLTALDRIDICKQCSEFKVFLQRCGICGCLMQFKTRLKSQHCPKGKW